MGFPDLRQGSRIRRIGSSFQTRMLSCREPSVFPQFTIARVRPRVAENHRPPTTHQARDARSRKSNRYLRRALLVPREVLQKLCQEARLVPQPLANWERSAASCRLVTHWAALFQVSRATLVKILGDGGWKIFLQKSPRQLGLFIDFCTIGLRMYDLL